MVAVRDGHNGAARKRGAHGGLDNGVRGVVHVASGLVREQQPHMLQQCVVPVFQDSTGN